MSRPQFIRFGRALCGDLAQAERREWWLSNGLGGYAAGTIAGTLTRRYHGLLIAPLQPPLGRVLVFTKADAWLEADGSVWPLCSNRWPDQIVEPQGYRHIEAFWLDGRMPVWQYAFGNLKLEMRIWLEPGSNTVYLAYKPDFPSRETGPLQLRVKLLVNARDHHGNTRRENFNPIVEPSGIDGLSVRHASDAGMPSYRLSFKACGGSFSAARDWYNNFELPIEAERGLDNHDHHLCVGECRLTLLNGVWNGLCASLHGDASPNIESAFLRFRAKDEQVLARACAPACGMSAAPDWIRQLLLAADSFLFVRADEGQDHGESVIAGFPWFGDWGRDSMIALPGLTLATGRYDSARRILLTFARYVDRGMLPNLFPGAGRRPEYNSADAALWYIEAWRAYVEASGDWTELRRHFPILEDIVRCHRNGTRHGIGMDPRDGLLKAGEPGVQLTWMDAKVGDWVVTPRIGKPVEINALWYNALETMAGFAERLARPAEQYRQQTFVTREGFQRFLISSDSAPVEGALFDVVDGPNGNDAALRPNQLLAVSLPFSPLSAEGRLAVVGKCGQMLLTSYGLRSLAATHPEYAPAYRGDVRARDGAYHQGTVWAWLLGHYALAEYRCHRDLGRALSRLEPIREHLLDAGLGTISEIFDADPPHTPRGAPAQAWSVACVLEAWWRLQREHSKPEGTASGLTTFKN
ncbi:amylo-alpha-1,6-glucosidase [Methylomonas sp. MgM2]